MARLLAEPETKILASPQRILEEKARDRAALTPQRIQAIPKDSSLEEKSRGHAEAWIPKAKARKRKGSVRATTLPKNRAMGWWGKEMAAVLVTSFVVSLLCFYVAAYARVTAEGFEVIHLARSLRKAEEKGQALSATISKLESQAEIQRRALEMDMEPGENPRLIVPASKEQDMPESRGVSVEETERMENENEG